MEDLKLNKIQRNLDLAKPMFEYYLENINWNMSQWFYLEKSTIENDEIWFHFRSSGTPLQFKIYAGLNDKGLNSLSAYYNDLYSYFQRVKWNYPIKNQPTNELS